MLRRFSDGFSGGVTSLLIISIRSRSLWILRLNVGIIPRKRKIFISILYGGLWSIWKCQNDKIFKKIIRHPLNLLTISLLWCLGGLDVGVISKTLIRLIVVVHRLVYYNLGVGVEVSFWCCSSVVYSFILLLLSCLLPC